MFYILLFALQFDHLNVYSNISVIMDENELDHVTFRQTSTERGSTHRWHEMIHACPSVYPVCSEMCLFHSKQRLHTPDCQSHLIFVQEINLPHGLHLRTGLLEMYLKAMPKWLWKYDATCQRFEILMMLAKTLFYHWTFDETHWRNVQTVIYDRLKVEEKKEKIN